MFPLGHRCAILSPQDRDQPSAAAPFRKRIAYAFETVPLRSSHDLHGRIQRGGGGTGGPDPPPLELPDY